MHANLSYQMMQANVAEFRRVADEQRRAADIDRPSLASRLSATLPRPALRRARSTQPSVAGSPAKSSAVSS
jgi:hypothetical protein